MNDSPVLKRVVTVPMLTLYGLGTIIGAGIYVLIGEVAARAGIYAPLSFLIAAVIAGFTAFTYAELSARFPRSAGEAWYIHQAFSLNWLSLAMGWAVVLVGIVSAAAMTIGFTGYFQVFVQLPSWVVIALVVVVLFSIATWGISESVWIAILVTLVEIAGLLFVLVISAEQAMENPLQLEISLPPMDFLLWTGLFMGAFLAFYAFIGFEDMVNIAEEVKDPERTLPVSIILALLVSTLLYVLVAIIAVLILPVDELSGAAAPLKNIVGKSSPQGALVISFISLFAVVNGALIQMIMASRVLYGMADQKLVPGFFALIHPVTRTPVYSTFLVAVAVLILALGFSLVGLARATSFITLVVFAAMHVSLILIKRKGSAPERAAEYPLWVPATGFVLIIVMLLVESSLLIHELLF